MEILNMIFIILFIIRIIGTTVWKSIQEMPQNIKN